MAAPADWVDEVGVLHKYDKSQYTGNSAPSQNAGGNNTTEKPTVESLRYPYNMKIDRDTDYLEMRIATYQPPGLQLGSFEKVDIGDTTIVIGEEQTTLSDNFKQQISQFAALRTGTDANAGSLKHPHTYICLPIPQAISDSSSVSWGPDTLDPLSAFGVGLAAAGLDSETSARGILQGLKTSLPGVLQDPGLQKAVIAVAANKAYGAFGGNVSVTGLISRASGQVFNPNLELLFNGVNLRSFPFTFDLAPRNQTEAKIVKSIIRSFKKAMTAKGTKKTNTGGIFISSPDIFQLTYKRGKDQHPFLNKFKPMALTDMQLNYTGSNTYATYADGTPIHITVSLTFTELNPIYAEDYDDNGIGVGF